MQPLHQLRPHRQQTPTPRGPAIHLRDDEYVTSAPTAQSMWPNAWAASTTSGSPNSRQSSAIIASGCTTPLWLATARQVDEIGWVGVQSKRRIV